LHAGGLCGLEERTSQVLIAKYCIFDIGIGLDSGRSAIESDPDKARVVAGLVGQETPGDPERIGLSL